MHFLLICTKRATSHESLSQTMHTITHFKTTTKQA